MYSCGVDTCKKTVDVSNTVNSKVALSRLKNHFAKMHRDMDSSSFSYETRYNKDVVNGDSDRFSRFTRALAVFFI